MFLKLWEIILPLVKDMRLRFALAMLGNLVILLVLINVFKQFVPDLPDTFPGSVNLIKIKLIFLLYLHAKHC